jgi:hypothetical protein
LRVPFSGCGEPAFSGFKVNQEGSFFLTFGDRALR